MVSEEGVGGEAREVKAGDTDPAEALVTDARKVPRAGRTKEEVAVVEVGVAGVGSRGLMEDCNVPGGMAAALGATKAWAEGEAAVTEGALKPVRKEVCAVGVVRLDASLTVEAVLVVAVEVVTVVVDWEMLVVAAADVVGGAREGMAREGARVVRCGAGDTRFVAVVVAVAVVIVVVAVVVVVVVGVTVDADVDDVVVVDVGATVDAVDAVDDVVAVIVVVIVDVVVTEGARKRLDTEGTGVAGWDGETVFERRVVTLVCRKARRPKVVEGKGEEAEAEAEAETEAETEEAGDEGEGAEGCSSAACKQVAHFFADH